MKQKNHVFVIVICCQGKSFYYCRKTLFGALIEFARQYIKQNKYETINFALIQEFR